jgi:type I restriction enzyme S subunit
MIHSRIDFGTLRDRLDASYYTPEVLENEAQLRARGATALRTLINTDASNYGVLPPSEDYLPSGIGVPLIRGGDLDGGTIRDPEVDAPLRFKNARGTANVGDVLLLIKGACIDSPAGVALVSERHAGSVFNGSCYRVRVASACDAGYLVAYCQTRHLLIQKKREMANTGIAYNAEDSVLGYLVLALSLDAQRYIGDKVRQAERLRERARGLEAAVATTHARFIVPPTGIDFAKRTRRLAARSLTERLDAHFYPSAVEQYFRQLGGPIRSLNRLCSHVVNGQTQPEAEEGVRQATVANLGRSFVEGSLRTVVRPADGSRALAPHDLLLCNAAHNKSYIGRDVTYSQVEGPYPSTEVMVVRVDRAQIPASFVRHYLKTEIGYQQVQSTIRGITAHSYPTDVKLLDIPIPAVPDVDRVGWFATDDQMLAAGRCFDAAKVLTRVATTLVEHLIDGRMTEAELVAAQNALEAGDRSADREILKALRQTDASDARPLIADVDALYALLDEPEGQDA